VEFDTGVPVLSLLMILSQHLGNGVHNFEDVYALLPFDPSVLRIQLGAQSPFQ